MLDRLKPKHLAVWLIVILGIVAVIFAVRPQPMPVDAMVIGKGDLRVTIDEEGETRVKERFVISSPLDGRVLRIELEPGDPVIMNETVLAMLQPRAPSFIDARQRTEAKARIKAAEAALGRAKADRDQAQTRSDFQAAEFKRYSGLTEIISRERLELAESNAKSSAEALKAADFAVRNAEYELAVAKATLMDPGAGESGEPIPIYAPVDGVLLKRYHESETMVASGEPLVEVADPTQLEIISDLLSTDAVKVKKGDKVIIDRWGGNQVLEGTVRVVEPHGFTKVSALGVEEQRVNVIIDLPAGKESRALGDGYRVEVGIVIWEGRDVPRAPGSALFRDGEDWAVFCMENGIAVLRKIKVGHRNGLYAEIVDGLDVGETVIIHPSDSIGDGVPVQEREAS